MSSKMPFTNYKNLKERMAEINKGFWKVQSIHKLSTKLSHRFNTKDFIIMKTIQKSPKYVPPFISFSNESHKFKITTNKSIKIKKNYKERKNFFLTNESQNKINETINAKKEKNKKLYLNLYKNFPYEPFLYNELQFIYLQGNNKIIPRKFNEVVKDCFLMDKYNKFMISKKYSLSKIKFNNSKNISKNTFFTSKSNNYNNEEKFIKSLSIERNSFKRKRNMNKKCKTENGDLEINTNNFGTEYEGFYNNKRPRRFNIFPFLGNNHITDGDTY